MKTEPVHKTIGLTKRSKIQVWHWDVKKQKTEKKWTDKWVCTSNTTLFIGVV